MSRSVRRQVAFVALFLIVVVVFVTMFRMAVVRGNSMEPTYVNGQLALVRRRNWFSPPLRHNDVILVRQNRDVIIKRVYRLEGEEMTDTYPYAVREMRRLHPNLMDYYEQQPVMRVLGGPFPRLFVPKGYLVVLGDNQRVSEDSRIFGPVPLRDVLGVVVNSPPPPYAGEAMQSPFEGQGR